MPGRRIVRDLELSVYPERAFGILVQPSAIRGWWGAARAIVVPRPGGVWAAAWGEREDDPDYVSACRIQLLQPPKQLILSDYSYYSRTGPLPFEADFVTRFDVESRPGGCLLRVTQDGFPEESVADAFFTACQVGWKNTFEGIRRFLNG